jgi:hypothetical protein
MFSEVILPNNDSFIASISEAVDALLGIVVPVPEVTPEFDDLVGVRENEVRIHPAIAVSSDPELTIANETQLRKASEEVNFESVWTFQLQLPGDGVLTATEHLSVTTLPCLGRSSGDGLATDCAVTVDGPLAGTSGAGIATEMVFRTPFVVLATVEGLAALLAGGVGRAVNPDCGEVALLGAEVAFALLERARYAVERCAAVPADSIRLLGSAHKSGLAVNTASDRLSGGDTLGSPVDGLPAVSTDGIWLDHNFLLDKEIVRSCVRAQEQGRNDPALGDYTTKTKHCGCVVKSNKNVSWDAYLKYTPWHTDRFNVYFYTGAVAIPNTMTIVTL